jgi:uncharacterized membrane protein YhhN
MAWQAWERWARLHTDTARLAAWGAALFVASDTTLALDRFLIPFSAHTVVVMTTYIAAQVLIALSIPQGRASRS